MLIRILTVLAFGVLVLGGVHVARQRSAEPVPNAAAGDPPLNGVPNPPAAGPVTEQKRVEKRFFTDPQTLAQVVHQFPGDYRLLSCGYDKPHEIWEVEFERLKPTEPSLIKRALRQYLDGELPAEELTISYGELHTHATGYSGRRITILGTGEVWENAFSATKTRGHTVSRDWVEHLVGLLLELEAWEQYVLVDRPAVPAGSLATLEINVSGASSTIWELPRHRQLDDRIVRVADLMKQLAWVEEHLAIVGYD
jgi:hypothetical protein